MKTKEEVEKILIEIEKRLNDFRCAGLLLAESIPGDYETLDEEVRNDLTDTIHGIYLSIKGRI